MTEVEWMQSSDPLEMVAHVWPDPHGRKVLFLIHACCEELGEYLPSALRTWIELTGPIAERQTTYSRVEELEVVEESAEIALQHVAETAPQTVAGAIHAVEDMYFLRWLHDIMEEGDEVWRESRKKQVILVRDIFGNPFRPVTLDPTWQTATVVALAEAIYAERAFDRLPILADALEEAGCTSAELLNHCRQPGDHVRGCWAVDLLLGKT